MSGRTGRVEIDGADVSFAVCEGDTILRAALRAGMPYPYECNAGGCGSCKFELLEGDVEELWPEAPGLSRRDIRKGRKLACQCRPRGAVHIRARLEKRTGEEPHPRRFSARYLGRDALTPDMAEFHFEPEAPVDFRPGQFAMFSIPGITGDRAYSFSSIPQQARLSFVIKLMPGGAASTWLFERLKPGDTVSMDGPYGLSYLRDTGRDIVLIAGGSGLSPVLSIARAAVSDPAFAGRTVMMFYGGRGPEDICTPELVGSLSGPGARLVCHAACSDPDRAREGWDGPVCNVPELVPQVLGEDLTSYEFYFCGPPAMTEAVQRMLMLDYKVPFEQLHFDRFF